MTLLEVGNAQVRFGGLVAFSDVSFTVGPGDRVAVIGPNGAGKTTLFNAISGLVKASAGTLMYDRRDLTRTPAHRRPALGIARTFQHSRLFGNRTLLEQVVCGSYGTSTQGLLSACLRKPAFIHEESDLRGRAMQLLDRFGIADSARRGPAELPGGHRRMADVARALISRPRLLLLDEVGAGLTEVEKERVIEVVTTEVTERALTLLFIEHDLDFVKALGERCIVLHEGRILATGEPAEVLARPDVLEAYVGATTKADHD